MHRSAAAATIAALVVALVVSFLGLKPPAPLDRAVNGFSEERARDLVNELTGDGTPHPVGSKANAQLRDLIVGKFRAIGYEPQVERSFVCNASGSCATVDNIVAVLAGTTGEKGLLVACHYDSVPAGPGASDDASSVAAVLETARLMRLEPAPRRRVVFLVDDGEEAGLLGAVAFTRSPHFATVGTVINAEARGTSGPSFMFETSAGNHALVNLFARSVTRPATASLFPAVYERLPNDTDFTIFKAAGLRGLNFAFIRSAQNYHTRLDDASHLSRRTLQHHGEMILAATRKLANAEELRDRGHDAVFFDVAGQFVVGWSEVFAMPFAIISALVIATLLAILVRRRHFAAKGIAIGAAITLVSLAGVIGLSMVLLAVLRFLGAFPSSWIASPAAAHLLFWAIAFAVPLLVARALARQASPLALIGGTAATLALITIAVTAFEPGFSYLVFVPAIVLTLPLFAALFGDRLAALFAAVAAGTIGLLMFPLAFVFYDALGANGFIPTAAFVTVVAAAAAPMIIVSRRSATLLSWTLLLVIGGSLVTAALVAPYDDETPQHLNFALIEEQGRPAVLLASEPIDALPSALASAGEWRNGPTMWSPWSRYDSAGAEVQSPSVEMEHPSFDVLQSRSDGTTRIVKGVFRSRRCAGRGFLAFPDGSRIEEVRVNGEALQGRTRATGRYLRDGWKLVGLRGPYCEETTIELRINGLAPIEVIVEDRSFGLPPTAAALVRARDTSPAVPVGDGDVVIARSRIRI